jgi:hypothetical protein
MRKELADIREWVLKCLGLAEPKATPKKRKGACPYRKLHPAVKRGAEQARPGERLE